MECLVNICLVKSPGRVPRRLKGPHCPRRGSVFYWAADKWRLQWKLKMSREGQRKPWRKEGGEGGGFRLSRRAWLEEPHLESSN